MLVARELEKIYVLMLLLIDELLTVVTLFYRYRTITLRANSSNMYMLVAKILTL